MKFALFLSMTLVSAYAAEDALKELQEGTLEFSAALYKNLIKNEKGNIIVSPLSVQIVLALLQLGARGPTAVELAKGLHLPSTPEKIKDGFKALLPKLKGNDYYSLDQANKIYIKDGYKINPEFFELAKNIFDAGLENVDFGNPTLAAQTINKWVESKTNEKIKDLISPDALNALTRMVLVNAVYFKANWSSPFENYSTQKRKFYKTEKDVIEVDTMNQVSSFKYYENKELDTKFVELPYVGGDVTFTIALPNKHQGLQGLENKLEDVLRPQNLSYQRINLFMPKFKIESTFKLIPALESLGIKKIFDSSQADLTGLLEEKEPLVVSDVIQKAFINVTESGTEAAAATAATVALLSLFIDECPPKVVEVNQPFLFWIKSKKINPLFVGKIENL